MKKIGVISGLFLIIIIIGISAINGVKIDTEVTREKTKVGFILNGTIDDGSWSQSHYEGMQKSAEELNLDVHYRECVPEDEQSFAVIEELIAKECEIIICNSFNYGEWIQKAAEKYPNVYFFHASGVVESKNLATYFGRMYQMRYLSGIVAGLQTETNEIGYVAAFPIPEVNRGINAFTIGVRSVNPDAVVYVEWTENWIGDKETEDAVNRLLDKNSIDVLAMHSDSLAALKIAEDKGIWSIGYNIDNSNTYKESFLTAPVWHWEHFYTPRILECLQGKFVGKHYWEGIETEMVSLAPLSSNVKAGIAEVVEKEHERLMSGTFDVFYGPVVDSNGDMRVEEGENMADSVMLNEFDWYVEGVVSYEK